MQPARHPMAMGKVTHTCIRHRRRWAVVGLALGLLAIIFPIRILRHSLWLPTKTRPVAVVDAGHGVLRKGSILDVGAAHYGLREADLVLDIAQRTQRALEARGWVAVTTRDSNWTPFSLSQRARLAEVVRADVFVSLHLNSHTSRQAHGLIVFYWRPDDAPLAKLLQRRLSEWLGLRNRGTATAPFTVLVWSPVPAVLVELAFLSHQREAQRLRNPQFREKAAQVLAEALTEWWKTQRRERQVSQSSSVPLRH